MAGLIQLALDFLGLAAPGGADAVGADAPDTGAMPPSARRGPRSARPGTAPPRAQRPRPEAPAAVDGGAALPRHPLANREASLLGHRVAYRLERGRRRTVGFTVAAEGLSVRAPGWLPIHQIEAALVEKAAWIVRKLIEAEGRRDRQEAARIVWAEGVAFALWGRQVAVRLGARRGAEGLRDIDENDRTDGARELWLALPADAPAEKIGDAVRAWVKREAKADFTARMDRFAPLLGVRWSRLSLTDARTRWGSASASGAIRLHWRLMHFRPEVIDYVVAHELAHLLHMDHSPRFWAAVGSVLPDYQALRAELRADAAPRW